MGCTLGNVSLFNSLLDTATCVVVLICLWMRRKSWRYKWEQPKTIGLALMAVGTLLKTPPIFWLINDEIQGLYVLIAHAFILGGIGAIVYSVEHKLRDDQTMRSWHITRVILPSVVGIGTMIGLFVAGARRSLNMYFQSPVIGTALAYWMVYDVLIVYLLLLGASALGHLLHDPPSRVGAGIYLLAVLFNLIGAVCRMVNVTVVHNPLLTGVVLGTNNIALWLFAGGAAWMWVIRLAKINRNGKTRDSNHQDQV